MSEADRERWDARYARGGGPVQEPNPLLASLAPFLRPVGRALDVACGRGGNALWLAAQGWHVEAVDLSPVALNSLRQTAAERGLAARVETLLADLDTWRPATKRYDLVVLTWYLDPALWPSLLECVRPGGLLFVRTFSQGTQHILAPERILRPGELLVRLAGWDWIAYREDSCHGDAAILARAPRNGYGR